MTDIAALERSYGRWLRCYPKTFRREHETEILGVLIAAAGEDRRRPELIDCLDLVRGALWMRLRPTVSRSDRSLFTAIKLMYLGAIVELGVVVTIVATMGNLRSNVSARNPGYTRADWHTTVTAGLRPLVVAATIAVGFWLLMAWANGRGHRWAPIAFALFFAMNTLSLLQGVAGGSAVYARPDLAAGLALWLVELAVLTLVLPRTLWTVFGKRQTPSPR